MCQRLIHIGDTGTTAAEKPGNAFKIVRHENTQQGYLCQGAFRCLRIFLPAIHALATLWKMPDTELDALLRYLLRYR